MSKLNQLLNMCHWPDLEKDIQEMITFIPNSISRRMLYTNDEQHFYVFLKGYISDKEYFLEEESVFSKEKYTIKPSASKIIQRIEKNLAHYNNLITTEILYFDKHLKYTNGKYYEHIPKGLIDDILGCLIEKNFKNKVIMYTDLLPQLEKNCSF